MARCEDFPACGHYDESTGPGGGSWCPDTKGRFPCATCGARLPRNSRSSLCPGCYRRMERALDNDDGLAW